MPKNEGIVPPYALVDIRYRCGIVVRGIEPNKRRWTLDDPDFGPDYEFNIADWQRSTGKD